MKKIFSTKIEFLNFKITLPLAKLETRKSKLVLNGLKFWNDIPINIQLVAFILIANISKLRIGEQHFLS